MRSIEIDTVQGIGDIIWVYRKLEPFYDLININVLIIDECVVQRRSEQFLRSLKKIEEVKFKIVGTDKYKAVASGFFVFPTEGGEYAVNAWLDSGVHIDNIDNNEVCWDLKLIINPVPLPFDNYLLVYISGCPHVASYHQLDNAYWVRLIKKACARIGTKNCYLIGAEYDREILNGICSMLPRNVKTKISTDLHITETMYVIKKSKYFLAYQSGLCMLAEEMGVKTFMIYFPENISLVNTWIRRNNLVNNLIGNAFFNMPIENIAALMDRHIMRFKW